MHVDVLIIGDIAIDKKMFAPLSFYQVKSAEIGDHTALCGGVKVCFDFLIVKEKIIPSLLTEDGYIITNAEYETSCDDIYAVGNKIKTTRSLNEQLKIITDNIKNK